MLVQPGEGCLGEALHAGCGHHAVERLKEGSDDDTELVGSEELRSSFAMTLCFAHSFQCGRHPLMAAEQTFLPGDGAELLGQQNRPWNRPAVCFPSTAPHLALAQTAGVMA